ncbi:putative transmembrane transcriptional regulator (anti-sigma factor) [Tritonibacter multivorans]|uniref:Putative transmembrane transcriptional regulator (Anti-sigma factor) n=1 Tax=Tritonibacter multivorans TaxID=928856 RepID=A0A0P1GVK0_9RHOB|nr:hypothetical protein [Tritonibacter multivorans]MDA7420043.1 hypothetical protein [Tritonibacter multivorans]CUH79574.1 putative transmembrane transcriptional regulator (anti-sigma factor) [Tritonibacter multivorans]SFC06894.1 Transmembrane transcriptional regulator (anti-sigma factor RsiW) [Tritonibacter multivorans]
MTQAHETFSDEDLTAFLDGEAEGDLSARIDAALLSDAQLVARLERLVIPVDDIRAAFAVEGLAPPTAPDLPAQTWIQPMAMAASVVLALGIGALGGYSFKPDTPAPVVAQKSGWIAAVASYQALYATETLAGKFQAPEQTDATLAGFEDRIGVDLVAATDVQGLDFKRAQILSYNGKPLMQMAYLDDGGVPFALCVIGSGAEARAMKDQIAEGLAASSWIVDGVGYLVIGGDDPALTRAYAEAFRAQLQQG